MLVKGAGTISTAGITHYSSQSVTINVIQPQLDINSGLFGAADLELTSFQEVYRVTTNLDNFITPSYQVTVPEKYQDVSNNFKFEPSSDSPSAFRVNTSFITAHNSVSNGLTDIDITVTNTDNNNNDSETISIALFRLTSGDNTSVDHGVNLLYTPSYDLSGAVIDSANPVSWEITNDTKYSVSSTGVITLNNGETTDYFDTHYNNFSNIQFKITVNNIEFYKSLTITVDPPDLTITSGSQSVIDGLLTTETTIYNAVSNYSGIPGYIVTWSLPNSDTGFQFKLFHDSEGVAVNQVPIFIFIFMFEPKRYGFV